MKTLLKKKPPASLRPLLWSFQWDEMDISEDKEDIIVNVINEGTIKDWRWLIKSYGKSTIRNVLKNRLETELHPESRNLAKIVFSVPFFRHARRSAYSKSGRTFPASRSI